MFICVCVCVNCVCLCQTGASPFVPACCSQSIEVDFSFFPHAEPFEEISKHSQSALHVLFCVQCRFFPLPLSACLSLSRIETHCLAKGVIDRNDCPAHPWSSLRNFNFRQLQFLNFDALLLTVKLVCTVWFKDSGRLCQNYVKYTNKLCFNWCWPNKGKSSARSMWVVNLTSSYRHYNHYFMRLLFRDKNTSVWKQLIKDFIVKHDIQNDLWLNLNRSNNRSNEK